jgi:hypothetical protein
MRIERRHAQIAAQPPRSKARTQEVIAKIGRVVDKAIVTAFLRTSLQKSSKDHH